MPAENDPAEPNALTQSLQLTCSLTPRSTVPSTRLVIIWLKRCLARSPTDPPLESAPVGVGEGVGVGVGVGVGQGPSQLAGTDVDGVVGICVEQGPSQLLDVCADAGDSCTGIRTSQI